MRHAKDRYRAASGASVSGVLRCSLQAAIDCRSLDVEQLGQIADRVVAIVMHTPQPSLMATTDKSRLARGLMRWAFCRGRWVSFRWGALSVLSV